jgi:signal transduction histidine kinase
MPAIDPSGSIADTLNRQQSKSLRELRAFQAITRRITVRLDLEATLPEITQCAVSLLHATAGVLVLWDDRRQVYRDTAVYNLPGDFVGRPIPKSANVSIGAYIIETGKPLVIKDYTNDPRSVPVLRPFGFKATVGVPLLRGDLAIGALIVLSTDAGREYDLDDVELLSVLADQATVAIDNALLYSREKERSREIAIAQEQERRKIARELHDEVCQTLLNMLMETSLRERTTTDEEMASCLREHAAGLRSMLEATRGLLADLRNVSLETLGLVGAIETELLPRWRRGGCCRVSFDSRDWPAELPMEVSLQIYRVLQEALANVKKHATADQVQIVLERRNGRLLLTVADDGIGFDPAAESARTDGSLRVGLEGMRERAGLLDARLEVRSTPGAGTTIALSAPYPPRRVPSSGAPRGRAT